MVKDKFNEYYTALYKELVKTFPKLQKSTTLSLAPAKLPMMYVRQIGGSATIDTLSGTSEFRQIGIEVQFFDKKQSVVRSLADEAMAYMIESQLFTCPYAQPEDNLENPDVQRFICRFEKTDT